MTPSFALAMAEASARAYDPKLVTMSKGGVEILIERMGDDVIVAFRGTTANYRDILNDLRGIPSEDEDLGYCHSGFLDPTREIWPELREHLRKMDVQPWGIHFTGHSKGAAEATIAAALMVVDPDFSGAPGSLTTFGSPRVGFKPLGAVLRYVPCHRYVNGWDFVATHPWALWGWPFKEGYRHIVDRLHLGRWRNRWEDHRMTEYIKALGAQEEDIDHG